MAWRDLLTLTAATDTLAAFKEQIGRVRNVKNQQSNFRKPSSCS